MGTTEKAWRSHRRKIGLCQLCPNYAFGKAHCSSCAEKQIIRQKNKRAERRRAGLCPSCGSKPRTGYRRCDRCRDKRHAASIRSLYGLTPGEYREMLLDQDGGCAICGDPPGTGYNTRRLHVDHDHTTGRVRALLCSRCNVILGMCDEDPERLRKVLQYIVTLCADCHDAIHQEAKSKGEDSSQVMPKGDVGKGKHGHD